MELLREVSYHGPVDGSGSKRCSMKWFGVALPLVLCLTACSSQQVVPGKKGTSPVWQAIPVEASAVAGDGAIQAAPETATAKPQEKPAVKAPEPAAEAKSQSKTAAPPHFAHRVIFWRAIEHPDALVLRTAKVPDLNEETLKELSYPHPFFPGQGNLETLVRRFIAKDSTPRDFDMRDAVMLPLPSTLEVAVPIRKQMSLSLSYCIKAEAFKGNKSAAPVLVSVTYKADNGANQVLVAKLDPAQIGDCKTWTDVDFPLPDTEGDEARVIIGGKSPTVATKNKDALIIANLALSVKVPQQADAPKTLALDQQLGRAGGPNVVIFFIDAGRGDSVGPANRSFPSVTPACDDLAESGISFTNAFSISNQTRASITGMLQAQHPTVGGFHSRWWKLRPEAIEAYYASSPPLLPLLARQAGYLTASVGRNHFQYGTTRMGLDPGFDIVFDNRKAKLDTVNIIDRAVAFIEENSDRKFFLLVNISPTHQPYHPPEEHMEWVRKRLEGFDKKQLPAMIEYLGELYYADQEMNRLFARMRELNLFDKSVVLVTADHGETMHDAHHCKSELFNTICHNSHGLTLYDEEIHVPLIWSAPFLKGRGPRIRNNVVSHLDVVPTLLDLMGLPQHARHQGRSLVPDMQGVEYPDEEIYVETRMASGVRIDGWKYILHHRKDDARTPAWLSGPKDTTKELYDLVKDPYETKNLVGKERERGGKLREALKRLRTGYKDREAQARPLKWTPVKADPAPGPTLQPIKPDSDPTHPTVPIDPTSAPKSEGDGVAIVAAASGEAQTEAVGRADARPAARETAVPATMHFIVNADRQERVFSGSITTTGTVLKAESLGENRCIEAATANAVALDCALTEDSFHFRLQVSPPGAPLSVELTMDDEPLDPYNLYLGRFGLALLDKTELETSDDFRLAYSSRAPHFVEGFDPGVFVWHSSPQAAMGSGVPLGLGPEELEFEGEESITDHAARKFLKDLGYWQ